MEEVVLERIRKDETDRQWSEYHTADEKKNGEPSQRQRDYIVALARGAGLRVNVSAIKDKEKASRLIERLKLLNKRMNGNGFDHELRDRKVAFGMATKLVFKKYVDRHKEFRRSERFWREVEELYREYQKRQESVVRSPVAVGF